MSSISTPHFDATVALLQSLVRTPSPSRSEQATATIIEQFLTAHGAAPHRTGTNVWALAQSYDPTRPTLLLNSHHDTVKPAASYTRDPYDGAISQGRLHGLGSNDAGGAAVALIHTFLSLAPGHLPFNLLLAITAEEEVGGEGGMRAFLPALQAQGITPTCAIVGEPTSMQPAVAERGLVVLDCTTPGVTGHAARGEGINAIYRAMADIQALRDWKPQRISAVLGPLTLNVTQIQAGWQHNAIPDSCSWVIDTRTTDAYTNEETVALLQGLVRYSTLTPRSTRVRASVIDTSHPLVQGAMAMGLTPFVSPTTSDMSLMHTFPSLKIGPGESSRSHSADEYILIDEIKHAIDTYTHLISHLTL